MWTSIWMVWVTSGVLGLGGLVLLAGAIWGRAGAGAATSSSEGCPCCGYPRAGLEGDVCPECGRDHASALRRRVRRVRLARGMGGCAGVLLAGAVLPLGEAVRGGLAHALPSVALIELVRFVPNEGIGARSELEVRVQAGALGTWGRRELADVCASVLNGRSGTGARREAALLAVRVARECEDATIRRMLSDQDAGVRACGVQALWRADRCGAWSKRALMSMANGDRSAMVRKRAVDAVRDVGGWEAQSTLVAALEDPNEGVRQRASFALAARPVDPASAMALAAVSAWDVDEGVREAARWALLRLGGAA